MDNFIEIYKNVFNDDFCNQAIEYFKVAEKCGATKDRQVHDKASKMNKEDLALFLPEYPMSHTNRNLVDTFNNLFWNNCYKQYAEKYSVLHTFGNHTSYTVKIQKTQPGQGYHIWHAEAANRETAHRLLTWTVYLNDEFEAGETEFLYQQYRYKPSKGDCIIFPAAYTHTHRGNPPIGGDKYIITGWVEF